ncbi:MAG: transglutaminase domain protein [Solirubrobacterales bacterium]|nr:transglutaminase domain protein [Solirubrobacterales bacterium]
MAVAAPPRDHRDTVVDARPHAGAGDRSSTPDPWLIPLQLVGFTALALFAARRWTAQLDPAPVARLDACAVIAVAVAVAITVGEGLRLRPWVARLLSAAGGVLVIGALLLLSGVGPDLLWVRHWDELAAGMRDGIVGLPDLRVPYRGEDEWVRIVLNLGGALLLLAAGVLVGRRGGRPLAATTVLGVLYAVPVVLTKQDHPFVDGALFASLAAFLAVGARVPRVQARAATVAVALALATALLIAPQLDGARPLVDYQHLGAQLRPQPTTLFQWNHSYEPLKWPRTGRELLRVRANNPAYWKGVSLDRFDGVRWLQSGLVTPATPDTELARSGRLDWLSRVSVTVRDLRSRQLYAPGEILKIVRSSTAWQPGSAGSVVTEHRLMTRGDSYVANVYTPKPSRRELQNAGTAYPTFTSSALRIELPASVGGPRSINPRTGHLDPGSAVAVSMPAWGTAGAQGPLRLSTTGQVYADGAQVLARSDYARTWALAQRLRAASTSPYDLALRIQQRVRQGATYDERPPHARVPLESFLFDTRRGYCQQFSGAMALLLRMGGVPARVAAGFAPGRRDPSRNEFVITDLDAHSWVEAYFPGIGWVVFDPTPAAAPPVTQNAGDPSLGGSADAGDPSRQTPAGPGSGAASGDGGSGPWLVAGAALALLGTFLGTWITAGHRRRRRASYTAGGPELAELLRALAVTGRTVTPATTLAQLQQRFSSSPDARRYLAAVARARFAGGAGPDHQDRRALRRGLGAGLGVRGRALAWWALPPFWPRAGALRALVRARMQRLRRGSYT